MCINMPSFISKFQIYDISKTESAALIEPVKLMEIIEIQSLCHQF